MLSKKMADAINEQINKEIYSSYLYLAMATYAIDAGLTGVANWFNIQVQEELSHAQKFYNYVSEQGAKVELKAIDKPDQEYASILNLFEKTLEHERKVTQMINNLVKIAKAENDAATEIFLQWFVSEQVEEEANATDLVNKFKLVGDNGSALLMMDKDLAQRVFTPPQAG